MECSIIKCKNKSSEKQCLLIILRKIANYPIGESCSIEEIKQEPTCQTCLQSSLFFLNVLGIVEFQNSKFKLKSIASSFFIKSLAEYIENDLEIFSCIEDFKGAPKNINDKNIFSCKAFLHALEKNRFNTLGSNAREINNIEIAKIIFKAKINNGEKFLMQYNGMGNHYSLIGGGIELTDKSPLHAAIREVNEELPEANLEINKNYKLKEIRKSNSKYISDKFGIITNYNVTLYFAYDVDIRVLSNIDNKRNRWISFKEIQKGQTKDGKRIFPYPNSEDILDAMNTCSLSFSKQRLVVSDFLNDNRVKIIGGIVTFLGIIVTLISIFS